ncbi:MAG: PadR family transcriptional regulator [Candidatus Aminicenantes bacterium]|nr:PadR family transcriptional regulator [Candidatus Aminicenantes bacterium]
MKDLTLYESIHLLAILRLGENAYGVTIKEEISEMTNREISYGTLYSYLDQLFKKNLVKKDIGDPTSERGGRRKIYYQITAKGVKALQAAYSLQKSIWERAPELAFENK